MPYVYVKNNSPRDRFQKIAIQMDNGETSVIEMGLAYDLTANEVARASRYVVLESGSVTSTEPIVIARLPILGDPDEGEVPIWSESNGAFIPGIVSGGGGGGGHIVQDEGSALTQRASLNFTGAGVTATDNSANNRTNITIPGIGAHTHPISDVTGLQTALDAAATDTDLSTHVADTTAVHGITDMTGVPYVLVWNGTNNYIPASLRTVTERPREFRGPTDPATIVPIVVSNYDTWIPTS